MIVWNDQMNEHLPKMGDMRYNPDTQMIEVYNSKDWITVAPHSRDQATWDIEYINEKTKQNALDELFGVK